MLSYSDPYVPTLRHGDINLCSVPEDKAGDSIDCAVICTNHRAFDYKRIVQTFPLIVDTRNALKGFDAKHIYRL